MRISVVALAVLLFPLSPRERAWVRGAIVAPPSPSAAALAEIDNAVRQSFWDPKLKGVDWTAAVARADADLKRAKTSSERDAAFDRLLATLSDSHTFRIPAGSLPERGWGTAGLRIGRDGDGWAVKGILQGSAAERAGIRLADRIVSVAGKPYGKDPLNLRDLFLVFEGAPGSALDVAWRPLAAGTEKTARLVRTPEEPGDALAWKSARVIKRDGKAYGYARLWGMSPETALAVVDMLLDRGALSRARPNLAGWEGIEGFLLDIRANAGGYDPGILATLLRGRWSTGDYVLRSREGRGAAPPEYKPLPVALIVNSGTASAGEALALSFRRHRIGPIVGEKTAGMASGGASARKLSDGSLLWLSESAMEDQDGKSYEGNGVPPDIEVADRPAARPGEEEPVVEAGLGALAGATRYPRSQ